MKLKIISIVLAVIIVIVAGFIITWFVTSRDYHQSNTMTDEQRYQQLLGECKKNYQQDTQQGRRYFRYPCQPSDIKAKFKQVYGREYTGAI